MVDTGIEPDGGALARRPFIAWHDNGALWWGWPLTLAVTGLGSALIGIALLLRAYGWADDMLAAGIAVLVAAFLGRLSSRIGERHHDVALPQYVAGPVPVPDGGRRSRTIRRRSGVAYLFGALTGPGFLLVGVGGWASTPPGILVGIGAFATGCMIGCYLAGPAARFVVTPRYLEIVTALRRTRVPRQLIGTFTRNSTDVRLSVNGGGYVYVAVDSPLILGSQHRTNDRTQLRTVGRIVAALAEVPAAPPIEGDEVVRVRRRGMVALAVTAVALIVGTLAAGMIAGALDAL